MQPVGLRTLVSHFPHGAFHYRPRLLRSIYTARGRFIRALCCRIIRCPVLVWNASVRGVLERRDHRQWFYTPYDFILIYPRCIASNSVGLQR